MSFPGPKPWKPKRPQLLVPRGHQKDSQPVVEMLPGDPFEHAARARELRWYRLRQVRQWKR